MSYRLTNLQKARHVRQQMALTAKEKAARMVNYQEYKTTLKMLVDTQMKLVEKGTTSNIMNSFISMMKREMETIEHMYVYLNLWKHNHL